jgi:rod shape-determining protein MreD
MRNTAFFFAGLGLLFVQSNLFRLTRLLQHGLSWLFIAFHFTDHEVSIPGLVPSLVLPLILFMGVHEYSLARGAGVAFALGYVTDLLGIAPVGLFTFTYVAIFVLARSAGVRLAAQTKWMQMLLVLAFAFVESLIVLVLLAIFGRDTWVPRTLYPLTLPHVLVTGAVSPAVFWLAQKIHAATAARERTDLAGGER